MMDIKEFEKLEREPNKTYILELEVSGFRILMGVYSSIKLCSKAIRFIPKSGKENFEIFKIREMIMDEHPNCEKDTVFTVRCSVGDKINRW